MNRNNAPPDRRNLKLLKRDQSTSTLSAIALSISLSLLALPAEAGSSSAAVRHKRASVPDTVGEFANFGQWQGVAEFIDQLVERDGFNKVELESLLSQTRYLDSAIQLMKPAPAGRPKNWQAYRARFVEPIRISAGSAFWDQYADALSRAEAQYGVPAEIIVGIIGVETVYGRNTGNFRVMDAITTLAFAYPNTPNRDTRSAYFKG
jgi:membrane-bound lytic murein transglycosylase B